MEAVASEASQTAVPISAPARSAIQRESLEYRWTRVVPRCQQLHWWTKNSPPTRLTLLTAAAFGYFEALALLGDAEKIRAERQRVGDLNGAVTELVSDPDYYYEDHVQPIFDLLLAINDLSPVERVEQVFQRFNVDGEESQWPVWHMRVSICVPLFDQSAWNALLT